MKEDYSRQSRHLVSHYQQISFRVRNGEYKRLIDAATAAGLSVRAYIIHAVNQSAGEEILTEPYKDEQTPDNPVNFGP